MAGIIYLIMTILSFFYWKTDVGFCALCSPDIATGFLNRSWYLWGAMFYALAGISTLKFKKNLYVGILVTSGAIFHAMLIYFTYTTTQSLCYTCIGLLTAGVAAVVIYFIEKEKPYENLIIFGPGQAMLLVAVLLFAINPQPVSNAGGVSNDNNDKEIKSVAYAAKDITVDSIQDSSEVTFNEPHRALQEERRTNFGPEIKVINSQGNETVIDISQRPALLFSWWCSHCDRVLKDIAQYNELNKPYLVAVYPKGENNKKYIEQKLKSCGLKDEPYYVYSDQPPINSIPILIWVSGNELKTMGYTIKNTEEKIIGKARIEIGDNNGGENALLAAEKIDNTVILPSSVFSFNKIVGERTQERGFFVSQIITGDGNGGYEYGQGIGGGICRTSTVLHWAVIDAGLEVVERHAHSLPVDYSINKEDAAVAWQYWDYRFRNNTNAKLIIKTLTTERWIEVQLWKNII
jgi:thiol-disulfide isomerase/thioredoxin